MLDVSRLKNKKTLLKLKEYEGKNEYLISLKERLEKEGSFTISPSLADYIETNFHKDPLDVNRVVGITDYLGDQLKEKFDLNHTPERVLVEQVLGETDKSYHVKGKVFKNQKYSPLFYIPKTQVYENLTDIVEEVEVDFDKYQELDKRGWRAFKHQEEGIKFLLSKKKCILGDDMGLGKTYQSIVAALESGVEKILVVCPANAKINWYREISNFVPEDDIVILQTGFYNPKKFTIINYDILKNFHTLVDRRKKYEEGEIKRFLYDEGFDLIIMDEAHMVKNPKANRTKIINQICENIDRRWLLTGTPIANRPMDFFNLLDLCESPVTSSWKYYAFRYCDGKKFRKKTKAGKFRDIWVTDGASNLEELHERTKNLVLRRKKEDHLDLPPKIVAPYYMELDDMEQYGRVFDEYLEWAKSEGKRLGAGRHMVELVVLRKYLASEKVKQSIELAEQAIENGQKVIIFTNFTDSFNDLMRHFGRIAVGHNGQMNGTQKQRSIDEFQSNDKIKVFVGNLISAGTAITLTEAEVVIMNDLDFVPANHAQAEDRAYRISQVNTVNVYYPIATGTIDEMMYNMLQKKRKIIDTVVGDGHESIDVAQDLMSAIKSIRSSS
jgi:SWI/SNF-related matrix-associated actin-dependent regulator 1 of chromatin subfamily A